MGKLSEHLKLLRAIDPDNDFENLVPIYDESYDGHIHSVREISTGITHLSQGETASKHGPVVAIYYNHRHEELNPEEYEIVSILQWNKENQSLDVTPYSEESHNE